MSSNFSVPITFEESREGVNNSMEATEEKASFSELRNHRKSGLGENFFWQGTSDPISGKEGTSTTASADDVLGTIGRRNISGSNDFAILESLGNLNLDSNLEVNGFGDICLRNCSPSNSFDSAYPAESSGSISNFHRQQDYIPNNKKASQSYSYGGHGGLAPRNFVTPSIGQPNTNTNSWGGNFVSLNTPQYPYVASNMPPGRLPVNAGSFELSDDSLEKEQPNPVTAVHTSLSSPLPVDSMGVPFGSQIVMGANAEPYGFPTYGFDRQTTESTSDSQISEISSKKNLEADGTPLMHNPKNSFNLIKDVSPSNAEVDGYANEHRDPTLSNGDFNFSTFNMQPTLPLSPYVGATTVWGQPPGTPNTVFRNFGNTPIMRTTFNQDRFPKKDNPRNIRSSPSGGQAGVSRRHLRDNNLPSRRSQRKRRGEDASRYANAKLEDFSGEIYLLCKDQHGCRFLQHQLDVNNDASTQLDHQSEKSDFLPGDIAATMIFNEIYLKVVELMMDPFGNYLAQKLFQKVSVDQRLILVKNASPEFIRIALDPHGTRALQTLIDCISTHEEAKILIGSLAQHIVSLSRDLNGNHVVQKCLQKLKAEENQFIFNALAKYCVEVATHRHGCCVLQRCLDYGTNEQKNQLSLKVAENTTSLSFDPFGNYVVQYVLDCCNDYCIEIILSHLKTNMISLSLHKSGSNVIEKSLRTERLTSSLISVLLQNTDRFAEMLNDAYGNYVLQTSLDVSKSRDFEILSDAISPLLPRVKNTPHGRKIMFKILNLNN